MAASAILALVALSSSTFAADVIDPSTCTTFPCLIFEDNFDYLDSDVWLHEINMGGAGNFEFQSYVNNRSISYTRDGLLFIKPELTSNWKSEEFVTEGDLDLWGMNGDNEVCTSNQFDGCRQKADGQNILNPVLSARLRSLDGFDFKYGRVEIRAKMCKGDWLWPAAWMLPRRHTYGFWPASGEMDIFEIRGNEEYGVNNSLSHYWAGSTMHWGPYFQLNRYDLTHQDFQSNLGDGVSFAEEFHVFALEWNDQGIKVFLNGEEKLNIDPGSGFFDFGGFASTIDIENPWTSGGKMAPFDKKFYLILNVAVGGTGGYFPDEVSNPPKPWTNDSPTAEKDFWAARDDWYPTWTRGLANRTSEESALQVDYIRVYKMSGADL